MLFPRRRSFSHALVACAVSLGLLACKSKSGSSSSDTTTTVVVPASAGGLYAGTLTSVSQGSTSSLTGAVNEGGALELVNTTSHLQYSGQLTVDSTATSGAPFTGTLRVYDASGTFSTTGTLAGTLDSRSRLVATYTLANGDSGNLALTYNSQYATPQTLAVAAGSYQWTSTRNGGVSTLTLNADGTLSGTTEYGCPFTGAASIADASYNLFNLALVASSASACGTAAGATFGGLAYYTPALGTTTAASGTSPAMLTLAATTSTTGIYASYTPRTSTGS